MADCDTMNPSTLPSIVSYEPALHENPAGILDDDDLVLSTDQAEQIRNFREELRLCASDTDKFHLCVQRRNHLLDQHTRLEFLIAALERIMCVGCSKYKEYKENKSKRTEETDAEQWDRFIGVATTRSDVRSKCLPPLKEVSHR
jgi:hypothetical protein